MTPTLAAVLIARNSEATIERCISSLRPHVDEIVIYLAGESTDSTPDLLAQIAAAPGAPVIVEQGVWTNDYAAARNAADALATSDFLLWMDDDEILEGGEHLHSILETGADVFCLQRVDVWWSDRVWVAFRPQIFRASLGARWISPIHEVRDPAVVAAAEAKVVLPDLVRIIHAPVKAPGRHKHRELVEQTYRRTGDRRLGCYVAEHLADDRDDEAALAVLDSIVAEPWPPADSDAVAQAYGKIGECKLRLGDAAGAAAAFEKFNEWKRQRPLRDPLIATMERLQRDYPIRPSDPLWATYADDARMAEPHDRRPPSVLSRAVPRAYAQGV